MFKTTLRWLHDKGILIGTLIVILASAFVSITGILLVEITVDWCRTHL